jgi:hypothetical protein
MSYSDELNCTCDSDGSVDCSCYDNDTDDLRYLMAQLATEQSNSGRWDKSYKPWRIRDYLSELSYAGISSVSDLRDLDAIPDNLVWNNVVVTDIANYLNMNIKHVEPTPKDAESKAAHYEAELKAVCADVALKLASLGVEVKVPGLISDVNAKPSTVDVKPTTEGDVKPTTEGDVKPPTEMDVSANKDDVSALSTETASLTI